VCTPVNNKAAKAKQQEKKMNTKFATAYDQNPVRICMVAKNIRKREGVVVPKVVGALITMQLAALFIWTAIV
jgi:hypothetical protein